jgi:hypothetical protein
MRRLRWHHSLQLEEATTAEIAEVALAAALLNLAVALRRLRYHHHRHHYFPRRYFLRHHHMLRGTKRLQPQMRRWSF